VCTFSMVIDHYIPFPDIYWDQPHIDELRRALEQARQLDKTLGKEDCVDPEKAKLIERVAELEKALPPADEVEIIGEVSKQLAKLGPDARKRVFIYLMAKFPS
jgi:hypothetical protein